MSDAVVVLPLTEVSPYSGPHALPGISFRPLRAALGVTAWGMNVLDLEPGCELYPEHDHIEDGQEEVYLVLEGAVMLRTGGRDYALEAGTACRVAPEVRRKLVTGAVGARVLAIGAAPGKAFVPTM